MKINHISYLHRELDECLDIINDYIETHGIKKEDILKFDYNEIKDAVNGRFWKIHLFYCKD